MMCGTPWAVRCTSTCCDRICGNRVTGVTAAGRTDREHASIAARASNAPVTEPTARMRERGRTIHEPVRPCFHPPDMHSAPIWHGREFMELTFPGCRAVETSMSADSQRATDER